MPYMIMAVIPNFIYTLGFVVGKMQYMEIKQLLCIFNCRRAIMKMHHEIHVRMEFPALILDSVQLM